MDEAMVPSDYLSAGLIKDDKLKIIFTKLRKEASCMIFMDCCHSGELLSRSCFCSLYIYVYIYVYIYI